MSIFNLSHIDKSQPKYLQLASVIRSAIRNGQLLAGDQLPSAQLLSKNLHINRHTVMKGLSELIAEGWIESEERIGYRVVVDLPVEHSLPLGEVEQFNNNQHLNYRIVKKGSYCSTLNATNYRYNFAGGQPDMALFPFNEFKSYLSNALTRPKLTELGYGDNAGTPELREQVKQYLRKTRGVIDREIVITNGSQEAIYIVSQLLLQTGDEVAVEALGYPPAMDAFRNAGAQVIAIKQDNKGMMPYDLEQKIIQGNIRLIYLTPLHQYPTTVTLPVSRRMAIYKLASKHNIPIIEDDYDHEFHFRCQPLPPMASSDPRQLVIYISTFSKIMFPGARVGFMALNKAFADVVAAHKMLICHKNNVVMQEGLAQWMKSGDFERNLRRVTRKYLHRRDHAVELLNKLDCFEFTAPDGGMALWLKLKNTHITASELAEAVKMKGVYIQHELAFLTDGANGSDQYIRLGYAGMSENKFAEGLAIIVNALSVS